MQAMRPTGEQGDYMDLSLSVVHLVSFRKDRIAYPSIVEASMGCFRSCLVDGDGPVSGYVRNDRTEDIKEGLGFEEGSDGGMFGNGCISEQDIGR